MHHLGEVSGHLEDFRKLGCEAIVIVQATPEVLTQFLTAHPQAIPMFCDPQRRAYRHFALDRVPWHTFLKPWVIWGYVRLLFKGMRAKWPYRGEDVRQLGGDLLLTADGRVLKSYFSRNPTWRPPMEDLLRDAETEAAVTSAEPAPWV